VVVKWQRERCGSVDNRFDLTIPVPGELNDRVEDQLEYGDSKAGWVRDAIRMRILLEEYSSLPDPTSLSAADWERVEMVAREYEQLDDFAESAPEESRESLEPDRDELKIVDKSE